MGLHQAVEPSMTTKEAREALRQASHPTIIPVDRGLAPVGSHILRQSVLAEAAPDPMQAFEEQLGSVSADADEAASASLVASDTWNTHDEHVRLWLQSSSGSSQLIELQQALQRAGVAKQIQQWTESGLVSKVDILAELLKTMSKSELAEVTRLSTSAQQ
jgi:hypothetical protein